MNQIFIGEYVSWRSTCRTRHVMISRWLSTCGSSPDHSSVLGFRFSDYSRLIVSPPLGVHWSSCGLRPSVLVFSSRGGATYLHSLGVCGGYLSGSAGSKRVSHSPMLFCIGPGLCAFRGRAQPIVFLRWVPPGGGWFVLNDGDSRPFVHSTCPLLGWGWVPP